MTSPVEWSFARRIGFRFAFVIAALLVFPFPIGVIPKTGWLASALAKPLDWGTNWLIAVLGLPPPYAGPNGSADRAYDYAQLLLVAAVAAIAAIAWSVIDRRRRSYSRLAAAGWVMLRYYIAYFMLVYGGLKVMKLQFYDLSPGVLHQRIGDAPPMRLLWAFMGYSLPYTVFAGLAETIGGVLLLWRRTATLGALIVIGVMANVVMLNLCYDVPVKLFSIQLLAMAIVIALPQARRLLGAVLGRSAIEILPRPRGSRRREQLRLAAKLALIAVMAFDLYPVLSRQRRHDDHVHELYGQWIVDDFVADGVDHPPLITDPVRWESWSADTTAMQVWLTSGVEGRNEFPERGWYSINVDSMARTITVTLDEKKQVTETWRYLQPAPNQLVLDAVHRGKSLHVTLHLEPAGVLMSRGFHWMNEVPFNR
jgi:uncharacterized membrane protein YphA (DoxX/SURF4 family)